MTPSDYDFLRKLLKERSGLTLSADKHYLVESRLLPVARKAGFEVTVIEDATRAIDLNGSLAAAWKQMMAKGVKRVQSADLLA